MLLKTVVNLFFSRVKSRILILPAFQHYFPTSDELKESVAVNINNNRPTESFRQPTCWVYEIKNIPD